MRYVCRLSFIFNLLNSGGSRISLTGLEEQTPDGVRQLIVLAMEKNWTEGEAAHVSSAPLDRPMHIA